MFLELIWAKQSICVCLRVCKEVKENDCFLIYLWKYMFRVILINYCIFQTVEQSPWEGESLLVKFLAFMETEDNYHHVDKRLQLAPVLSHLSWI
jgi:hypothetical protein